MRLYKLESLLIGLIFIFLTACGSPPLVRPEGQNTTTPIIVTEETPITTPAASEEPLSEATATLATIDESLVATPVSPIATPTTTKPSFMAENLKVSNEIQLTEDKALGHLAHGIAWSSDSQKIALTKYSGKAVEVKGGFIQITELWTANADGTSPETISDNGYWPEWAPDNKSIAYLSFEKDIVSLYKTSPTDKQPTQLVDLTSSSRLAWLATDEILFNDNDQVQKVRPSDKSLTPFSGLALSQSDVVAILSAPDKQGVAIADGTNLHVGDASANLTQISDNFYPTLGSLAWSGDSRKIGYITNWQEIFIFDRITRQSQKVFAIETAKLSGALTLSPDGNVAAFDATIKDESGIFVINADGTALRRLMDGHNPVWSPDGSYICFEKEDGNLWLTRIELA